LLALPFDPSGGDWPFARREAVDVSLLGTIKEKKLGFWGVDWTPGGEREVVRGGAKCGINRRTGRRTGGNTSRITFKGGKEGLLVRRAHRCAEKRRKVWPEGKV